jgi:non-specific serine/threonine protein kinase
LWLFALSVVEFRECLALCRKCELLGATTGDATPSFTADYMFGTTRFYLGEHAAAAVHLKRALSTYPMAMRSGDPIRYGTDLVSLMLCLQARAFWSLGFAEQAYRAGRDAIREARSVDSPVALSIAVGGILLVTMDYLDDAEHCIEELIDHSGKHLLHPFHAVGLCSKGGLVAARAEAERLLCVGLQRSREVAYLRFDAYFQGELAAVLASCGRIDEALVEIDAALRSAEESESLWCMPELLRIKGGIILISNQVDTIAAEKQFGRSLDLAHKQGALSSELRAATSLARLQRDRGRKHEARDILASVYGRFTEGFDTANLIAAKQLLNELGTLDHD